jgi:dihydrofolate synthase/folylpolyglutamate synthase
MILIVKISIFVICSKLFRLMDTLKEYDTIISKLFQRFPSVQQAQFKDAYKPGLGRMEEFDALLGHPHRNFPAIHVAGTNGKGSVCNMLASCLAGAGLRVGLYTSPHISDFRERMRIVEGRGARPALIGKNEVLDFIGRWFPTFERLELSFFEITTAMAFQWFSDRKVDVAVIEVGLGGRLDSTNIIVPILSIITNIGLDHCQYLGNTLAEIAAEKGGIIKPGMPALIGESLPETAPVFERISSSVNKGPGFLDYAEKKVPELWRVHDKILDEMDLQGSYQAKNLRTALAALDILKEMPMYGSLHDDREIIADIVHTAARMDFHGRWERLCVQPDVICDIGHNPPALKYNFHQLEQYLAEGRCSSLIIIYGVMADKDLSSIMPLMPRDAIYIFTTPSTDRAMPSEEIKRRYLAFCDSDGRNKANAHSSESVREAIGMAVTMQKRLLSGGTSPKSSEPLIYIGGSTFVVADAVPYFASGK